MIVYPILFSWNVSEDDGVCFTCRENPEFTLCEKYYSRGKIPPLSERVKYLRLAGKSEKFIKKIIKFQLNERKNSEKNQKIIDDIFMKFNIKPLKKKVLKSVKKL